MNTQPIDIVALLAEREQIQKWLKTAQEREMEIRKTLTASLFPDAKEGTQRVEQDGYVFKMVQPLTRKLDEAALDAIMPQMPEQFRQIGVLVKYTPGLVKAGYDALTEQDRKVFDQALTITPGAPQLTIEKIKSSEDAAMHAMEMSREVNTPIMNAYDKAKESVHLDKDGTTRVYKFVKTPVSVNKAVSIDPKTLKLADKAADKKFSKSATKQLDLNIKRTEQALEKLTKKKGAK